jgi:hypothetical protein
MRRGHPTGDSRKEAMIAHLSRANEIEGRSLFLAPDGRNLWLFSLNGYWLPIRLIRRAINFEWTE